mmetsp:Transcript_5183/g.11675  ORF Transcript_5183/g.11675 Transcript_5183/m.11675 type:complete len:87 (-) Transcript_5183:340-600(-)
MHERKSVGNQTCCLLGDVVGLQHVVKSKYRLKVSFIRKKGNRRSPWLGVYTKEREKRCEHPLNCKERRMKEAGRSEVTDGRTQACG